MKAGPQWVDVTGTQLWSSNQQGTKLVHQQSVVLPAGIDHTIISPFLSSAGNRFYD
jgi:hypothetical protein